MGKTILAIIHSPLLISLKFTKFHPLLDLLVDKHPSKCMDQVSHHHHSKRAQFLSSSAQLKLRMLKKHKSVTSHGALRGTTKISSSQRIFYRKLRRTIKLSRRDSQLRSTYLQLLQTFQTQLSTQTQMWEISADQSTFKLVRKSQSSRLTTETLMEIW